MHPVMQPAVHSYTIAEAANAANIGEATYALGQGTVTFTNFNSCVGIIVLDTDYKLNAVHLVSNKNGVTFGTVQAKAIKAVFPHDWVEVAFVGDVSPWRLGQQAMFNGHLWVDPPNGGFVELYNYFTSKGTHSDHENGDGIYSATVETTIQGQNRTRRKSIHVTHHP